MSLEIALLDCYLKVKYTMVREPNKLERNQCDSCMSIYSLLLTSYPLSLACAEPIPE